MILFRLWTVSFRRNQIAAKTVSQFKRLDQRKNSDLPCKWRIWISFSSIDLEHFFESFVGSKFGATLRVKEPQKPEVACNIIRIHSCIIYTDVIEYKIVGNTMTFLLRCSPFIWKPEFGDFSTTGEYMNYQTFGNLQFRPLLKNSVLFTLTWEIPAMKTYILYLLISLVLSWCLKNLPSFISNQNDFTRWLLQDR